MATPGSVEARLKVLEKEVQVLKDREAIRELLASYAYHNDFPDYEGLGSFLPLKVKST